jgi:hypothetical protein
MTALKNYDELIAELNDAATLLNDGRVDDFGGLADTLKYAAATIQELQAELTQTKLLHLAASETVNDLWVQRDELRAKLAALTVEDELPPLPEPGSVMEWGNKKLWSAFTAEQFIQAMRDAQAMLREKLALQEPVAYVPVHPEIGPLWANTTNDPNPERLPSTFPLRKLYLAAGAAPQAQPLTDEEIETLAHRAATKYTHRSDPAYHSYGFVRHTLIDFARKILEAQGEQQ